VHGVGPAKREPIHEITGHARDARRQLDDLELAEYAINEGAAAVEIVRREPSRTTRRRERRTRFRVGLPTRGDAVGYRPRVGDDLPSRLAREDRLEQR
jgi:hypothetical protein